MHYASTNPHDPSDVVMQVDLAGAERVADVVGIATEAAHSAAASPAPVRARHLNDLASRLEQGADELAGLIVREVGKPVREAEGEVARAIAIHRYFAQAALAADGTTYPSATGTAWLMTRRGPVGVAALITPWNFPLAIPAWKAAPALAYGNAVILKPAPESSAVALRYGEHAREVFGNDVLQVVHGDAEAGEALVAHPAVGAVSFTGSRTVGMSVATTVLARGGKVQCEMSGNNASIVLADADLDAAAATIAAAAMGYAGQKCTATSRVIVESPVAGDFRERLVDEVGRLGVTDPSSADCVVGPLIDADARSSAQRAIERLDGSVLAGGDAVDGEPGWYLEPTLLELDWRAQGQTDEIFAPVATVAEVPDARAALAAANMGPLGLAAAVFTTRLDHAMAVADRLDAGLVRVNAPTSGVDYHVPFGGLKASSIGPREQGSAAQDFFTKERTILVDPGTAALQ